jgi:hypothetical protein
MGAREAAPVHPSIAKGDASKQWNDPPLPMRSAKKKKAAYVAPALTAFNPMGGGAAGAPPMMMGGSELQQQQPAMVGPPPGGLPQQHHQQQQQYSQQQPQQQQPQQPQHQMQQQGQQHYAQPQQQQQQQYTALPTQPAAQAVAEPPPSEADEEEEAAPLPAMPTEFQPIVNMFNEKLQVCLNGQKNMTYKRKLEDAQKRLSPLYHAMAFRKVDATFANGLHQLAYALQAKDYGTAGNWHQYLLQQGAPAELSSTMIGIKGLIHVAKSMNM